MISGDLDVVVFGATGVTGRQVARYLADRGLERWAVAVRDLAKGERLLQEESIDSCELIEAAIDDQGSLGAMARRARVVLNLVGPYSRYGRPVVQACIDGGAHYADLSGEIPYLRRTIEVFDDAAQAAGVKIVQPCGFESLPADIAVRLAAESAQARWSEHLETVELVVRLVPPAGPPRVSDGMSGGTLASMVAVIEDDSPAVTADPAALIVGDPRRADEVRTRSPISLMPRRGRGDTVIAPMVPVAYINPAVIQRAASLAEGDAPPPRYTEGVALVGSPATLPLRWAASGVLAGVQCGLRAALAAGPSVRRRVGGALSTVLPGSGYGPRPDRLEGWRWTMAVAARTDGAHAVDVEIDGAGHVGYLATARMLAEAGVLLAEDGVTPDRAGCLTPALALGTATAGRFERAGLRFTVTARDR